MATCCSPIYRFGEGVLGGEDIAVSASEVRIPGYAQAIPLDVENPFEDMMD